MMKEFEGIIYFSKPSRKCHLDSYNNQVINNVIDYGLDKSESIRNEKIKSILEKIIHDNFSYTDLKHNFVEYSDLLYHLGIEAYDHLKQYDMNYPEIEFLIHGNDIYAGEIYDNHINIYLRGNANDLNSVLHELGHYDKSFILERRALMGYAIRNPSKYERVLQFNLDKKLKWFDEAYAMYFNYKGLKFLLDEYSDEPFVYEFVKKAAEEFVKDVEVFSCDPRKLPRRIRKLYHNATKIFLVWYNKGYDLNELKIEWTKY